MKVFYTISQCTVLSLLHVKSFNTNSCFFSFFKIVNERLGVNKNGRHSSDSSAQHNT